MILPQRVADLEILAQIRLNRVGVKLQHQEVMQTFLNVLKAHAPRMYAHSLRVGIYADNLAAKSLEEHKEDNRRLALMGGCMHDIGKCKSRKELLDGRDITLTEYEEVKNHAYEGFLMLKDHLPLTAMVAGMHHWKDGRGYGATLDDLPFAPHLRTKGLLVEIVRSVSISDYFDAVQSRNNPRFGLDREDRRQVTEAIRKEYRLKREDAIRVVRELYNMRFDWQDDTVFGKLPTEH